MVFNNEQRNALTYGEGPCMVLAGPGSGKTFTIAARVGYLIERLEVRPEEILVVTFSKMASLEMKNRFQEMTDYRYGGVSFGTFHGIFYGILKWAGVIKGDALLKEFEKQELIRETLKNVEIPESEVIDEDLGESLLGAISKVKNELKHLEELEEVRISGIPLKEVYEQYEELKGKQGKIDFEDMIHLCYELFTQKKDVLKLWQKRFKYILVDEFQDVNKAQYELIKLLALPENNLFIVGDDDQSIYRFRGATPHIMEQFTKDFKGCKQLLLNVNYRSTGFIVGSAARVIKKNKQRFKKEIKALKESPETVHVQEVADVNEEAEYVAALIKEQLASDVPAKEIAVLYRTGMEALVVAELLQKADIPICYKDTLPNLYSHFILKDFLSYLRLAGKEYKRVHFYRIMNKPLRYLSKQCVKAEAFTPAEIETYYQDKEYMVNRVSTLFWDLKMIADKPPYLALDYIYNKMGYKDYLKEHGAKYMVSFSKLEEVVQEALEQAKGFTTIAEWCQMAEEMGQAKRNESQTSENEGVVLSSYHRAKGLEYDTVILLRSNEGVIPHRKASSVEAIEEERRLFYVGMTRAKRKLVITYVQEKNGKAISPSRFVQDLLISS
ncbi:ATP-dependent helicase [Ohessyouella blattaphilus]|uniref:DNA 3'-5' helicase n=1 Tax=Ohessyouella blattaphilus TaxID=2949333 RepID=A0ABT1EFJ1_9FIRM|nr:ATP-dependent helicase [Ohessyouella blattaphilus]MCP1109477.1 ATP-dependent helicase [Ohessyouella blattaphilus]MCR8562871.1 ATP-dependent helicase [Ohessyouella blattaphilus]